ncbi:hypothetical protein Tco_0643212 [Tanacetum coccineum]
MNVCDLEEEKRERSLDNNSYVSDQDMCFRKKGRREKTRSDRIFGKRKSDFEMGGPVFIGDKKVAVAGGEWITEPLALKIHIFNSFHVRFKEDNHSIPLYSSNLFKQLSLEESILLDSPFTMDEIKEAVCNCGSSKAPGPDGFTFKFFKKHWNTLEQDILSYVKDFEASGSIPRAYNSSFITLVHKVEDPLVIGDFHPISLIVEALNVALLEATSNYIFKGIKVGKDMVYISHLQFADDALIMGKWSRSNAMNLSRILTCLYLASGLKLTFIKSKLYGVGVSNVELNSLASTVGCIAAQFPYTYLGLPIGASMSRCHHWTPLVDRFHKRLSTWKYKSLFIGGRLTPNKSVLGSLGVYYFSTYKAPKKIINKLESIRRNFFWGGSMDHNKIPWIAWEKVLSPRDHGGLAVSKQWLRILISPDFTRKRSQIRNLDPPAGIFSCNGLLLCTGWGSHFDYVYNPSTNLVKMLPEPDYAHDDSNVYGCAGLRLTFEPTKSSDYKVVRARSNSCEIVITVTLQ